jgi:hypothetical protein
MDFSSPPPFRYTNAQKNHTLIHPTLPQPFESMTTTARTTTMIHQRNEGGDSEAANNQHLSSLSDPRKQNDVDDDDDDQFSFIVCADTQLGMTNDNREWQEEIAYSKQAIAYMNQMDPPPLFCCVCGMYKLKSSTHHRSSTTTTTGFS